MVDGSDIDLLKNLENEMQWLSIVNNEDEGANVDPELNQAMFTLEVHNLVGNRITVIEVGDLAMLESKLIASVKLDDCLNNCIPYKQIVSDELVLNRVSEELKIATELLKLQVEIEGIQLSERAYKANAAVVAK